VEVVVNLDEVDREGLPGKGFQVDGLPEGRSQGHFRQELSVSRAPR